MKKKINIILIFIVLTIWILVFYKSISNLFNNTDTSSEKKYETIKLSNIKKDTFNFSTIIYDPFLDLPIYIKSKKIKKNITIGKKYSYLKITNIKNPIIKSKVISKYTSNSIKYFGYIKSSNNNDVLIILKIKDSIKKIPFRKKNKDFSIINFYKDSITLLINKEKLTVKKNQ